MSEKPTIGLELYSNLRVQFDLLQSKNVKLREALRRISQHSWIDDNHVSKRIAEEVLQTESNSTSDK